MNKNLKKNFPAFCACCVCCCITAATPLLTACTNDDHGIDDYPLNYQITEVKATHDIPVGVYLVNAYGDLSNAALWERLTNTYDAATGEIGPNVTPLLGQYRLVSANHDDHEDIAHNLGQIAAWAKKAKIDFLITHPIRENGGSSWEKDSYPNNINVEDSIFLNLISGRTDTLGWRNDGTTKFAIQIHTQNISAAMGNKQAHLPLYTYDNNRNHTFHPYLAHWPVASPRNPSMDAQKRPVASQPQAALRNER